MCLEIKYALGIHKNNVKPIVPILGGSMQPALLV